VVLDHRCPPQPMTALPGRLPAAALPRLQAQADRLGCSRTALARTLLLQGLAQSFMSIGPDLRVGIISGGVCDSNLNGPPLPFDALSLVRRRIDFFMASPRIDGYADAVIVAKALDAKGCCTIASPGWERNRFTVL